MNELTTIKTGADLQAYRASTEAADICKEIVVATASKIGGRQYVAVEGWQAIAVAHGCVASAIDVRRITDEGCEGFAATGLLRRMSDGLEIGRAEGFVGDDEKTWGKRDVYARRAMAQTRAISRVCRSAFAHVVVMMKAGLATTPAEEIPYDAEIFEAVPTNEPAARTKLDGPHTSKSALKAAVVKVCNQVRAAQSIEVLDAVKEEHKQTINQALRDWPELINGDPNVEEDVGLKGAFEQRRAELEPASLNLQMLLSVLDTCATRNDLSALLDEHGAVAEALDDAEEAKWAAAYDAREAAIMAAAPMGAG